MSIYAAETSARTGRDDILLSRLFGTLFMVNREGYLGALLGEAGVKIPQGDYSSLQVQFWPELGSYSPDVIVEGESILLFVVSGPPEKFDGEKLRLLAETGWKLSSRFQLLVISEDTKRPAALADFEADLPARRREGAVAWLSWRSIYSLIHQTLIQRDENATTSDLIRALLGLMESEGLAPFVGFAMTDLKSYREALPAVDRIHGATKLLVADMEHQLLDTGIQRIASHSADSHDLPGKAKRTLTVDFAEELWDPAILSSGRLFLRVDYLVGEIQVGFKANVTEQNARALLVEGRNQIANLLEGEPEMQLRIIRNGEQAEPTRDAARIAQLETAEGTQVKRVEIAFVIDGERGNIMPDLLERFTTLRDFVVKVPLLPLHRSPGESPFVVAGS